MQPIKNPFARLLVYVILSLFVIFTSLPFIWTVLQSLKTLRQANSRTPLFIFTPTLESYAQLWLASTPDNAPMLAMGCVGAVLLVLLVAVLLNRWRIPKAVVWGVVIAGFGLIFWAIPRLVDTADFYTFFINSLVVTTATMLISISTGSLAGYGLARFRALDSVVILIAALAFRALPRMAFALPYFQLATVTGLQDSYLVLILVLVATEQPFAIWMLRSFFMDIPREIEESAMVDGASRLRAFLSVIMPIMWPGIVATALFMILGAYHEFLLVRVLTQLRWTLAVAITQYIGSDYTTISTIPYAAAVSATLPLLIVVLFFQEQLVKGLTAGAVKG
jgi:multiple sugar transport system permease protein